MTRMPLQISMQSRKRGLSIVELMIGIAIGLFIVAGATLMLTTQLGDNRRLLLEAQVQQDMRAAADMISRDIRRAGYWGQSYCQLWPKPPAPACPVQTNPYNRIERSAAPLGTDSIEYDRSTDEEMRFLGFDDNRVDAEANRPRERVGFQLNATNKTIDYQVGSNNWQALTDKEALEVTTFRLDLISRLVDVPCGAGPCGPCDAADRCPAINPITNCRLVQIHRDLTITIVARAKHDAAVQRALRDNVRLRNSAPREAC